MLDKLQSDECVVQIHQSYWHRLRRPLERLTWAFSLGLLVFASWLGRFGTSSGRLAAGGLIGLLVLWVAYARTRSGRVSKRSEQVFRKIVSSIDPILATKLLKAKTLVEQSADPERHVSAELSRVHYMRLLAKVDLRQVSECAERRARALNVAAALGFALGLGVLLSDPYRVAEGMNVMLARKGRAPVTTTWLELEPAVAHAPSYLRMPLQSVQWGEPVALPRGTSLTLHGVERYRGREVILTDGTQVVPFSSDGHGGVSARFDLNRSGRWFVAARFGSVLIVQSPPFEVTALRDEVPEVVLDDAPRQFELVALSELTLRYRASDDHGLRQIDLSLRSGHREERRPLMKLDGETRQYEGAFVLGMDDPFISDSTGRILVSIVARDDNTRDGPSYGNSDAIALEPKAIGSKEKQRYLALEQVRDSWIDWLDLLRQRLPRRVLEAHYEQQVIPGVSRFFEQLGSPGKTDSSLRGFVRAQSEKLRPEQLSGPNGDKTLTYAILAVDALLQTLGQRDSEQVSRQLARVALESELTARSARGSEGQRQAYYELNEGQERLRRGASNLGALGWLGADLGTIATAGAQRIERLLVANDWTNLERAASFLAERLDRPVPSFVGGSHPGVEAGYSLSLSRTRPSGALRPSEADTRFERLANELASLTEEHARAIESVRQVLERSEPTDESPSVVREAIEQAKSLHRDIEALPELGGDPGTVHAALALAKELARGAAESLSRNALSSALSGLRQAEGAFAEAEQLDREMAWGNADQRRVWQRAKSRATVVRRWLEQTLEARRRDVSQPSAQLLRQLASLERGLYERTQALVARESSRDSVLPEDDLSRLRQAARWMDQAASELAIGRGPTAFDRQRAAQSLLEQLDVGQSSKGRSEDATRGTTRGERRSAGEGQVAATSDVEARERFRRRVLDGLSQEVPSDSVAKVRRYAEGLLR